MIAGGEFEVSGGELVNNDVTLSGGRMRLVNADLDFGGGHQFTITGGVFTGNGNVNGLDALVNGGEVMPGDAGPGLLICSDGSYIQTADGKLTVEIGGPQAGTGYDQLQAIKASLDGTLEIHLLNGFVPNLGDEFKVLATQNQLPAGQFANVIGGSIDTTKKFLIVYDDTGVILRVVAGL